METQVRTIPILEPCPKRWSEAKTIITEKDLKGAESSESNDSIDGERTSIENELNVNNQVKSCLTTNMLDVRVHAENLNDGYHGRLQGHLYTSDTFRTPQKLKSDYVQNLQPLSPSLRKSLSETLINQKSDWMLAEMSTSRSPASPAVGSRSPEVKSVSPRVHMSPSVQNGFSVFRYSPETTEPYLNEINEQPRRIKKNLFQDLSSVVPEISRSPGYHSPVRPSPSHRFTDHFSPKTLRVPENQAREHVLPQDLTSRALSPSESHDQLLYLRNLTSLIPNSDRLRAKRRLDVDQEFVSTPKRVKISEIDVEREMGYRYIQQLECDIKSIQERLRFHDPEVTKPGNCTCVIMEKQFLEMAESAYRSVRRIDASPRGFEQFRRELIQTNEVMKDSMDVLKNIKNFCFCENKK